MIWQKPSRVQLAGWISAIVFSLVGTVAFATAERVISFAPHATELAYAAGLGDSLIAASDYSDYPPEANRLERVASWQGINLERVLALKPDLILAWRGGNPQKVLDQLSGFGIPIVYTDADTIDGIAADLSQLAPYSPHPEEALQAAQKLLEQKAALEKRYKKADAPPINVFLQFSNQPLFTASGKALQSEVVALCGGKNVFADSPAPWPQVSREQVLARRPEAILIAGDGSQEENVRAFWRGQLEVPIISVPEDWFNRSGPRIMLAAEAVCQKLSQISSGS